MYQVCHCSWAIPSCCTLCLLNQNKAGVVIVETELLILPEPDTLESVDDVALVLNYQGNYDEAEGMH